jgi:hypothetical protein
MTTFVVGEEGNNMGHLLRVIATNSPPTKDTGAVSGTIAMPAVHR